MTERSTFFADRNKVHFACFHCRKAFKQRGSSRTVPAGPERPFPCPGCQREMARFGLHFKAPPQRARRQWLKVELLFRYGERFGSSHSGVGTAYRTLASVVNFLSSEARPRSEVLRTLEQIRLSHPPDSEP